jgi:hypothetical protein
MSGPLWHGTAHCINSGCDWDIDAAGEGKVGQMVDLQARNHMDAEPGHATSNAIHRIIYCKELGCGPAPVE